MDERTKAMIARLQTGLARKCEEAISKRVGFCHYLLTASKHDESAQRLADDIAEILKTVSHSVTESHKADNLTTPALLFETAAQIDGFIGIAQTPGASARILEICRRASTSNKLVLIPGEFSRGFVSLVLHQVYRVTTHHFNQHLTDEEREKLMSTIAEHAINQMLQKAHSDQLAMQNRRPSIGIVTALDIEYDAVRAILAAPYDDSRIDANGRVSIYTYGRLASLTGMHEVILVRSGKGNNAAAMAATEMAKENPSIREMIMVGIAGGVPEPSMPDKHIRLGDIVVSNEYGVIQYDMVKKSNYGRKHVHYPRPSSPNLLKLVHRLLDCTDPNRALWQHLDELSNAMKINRPRTQLNKDSLWSKTAFKNPTDKKRTKGRPRVHLGEIGSSNTLLKDAKMRDYLKETLGVRAIEMEGSGLADASHEFLKQYLVVRGICDYCNVKKNDIWQPYATIVAAAFLKELLGKMPSHI
ncbi:MAG: hypothetical protein IPM46_10875 [Flavobacteriales bacterium]|nr:hypothetical protein [Flavobacteriales bacterium]